MHASVYTTCRLSVLQGRGCKPEVWQGTCVVSLDAQALRLHLVFTLIQDSNIKCLQVVSFFTVKTTQAADQVWGGGLSFCR